MRKITISVLAIFIASFFVSVSAQRTVSLGTSGTLWKLLTSQDKSTLTSLTINGHLNQKDFVVLRDSMPMLTSVNMSQATIDSLKVGVVVYPKNQIPDFAFYNNTMLQTITLPNSCNSIAEGSFSGCSSLINLNLPSTPLVSVGQNAFNSCVGLSGQFLLNCTSTTSIEQGAFQGCVNLTSVVLKGVQAIGSNCFDGCINLKSVDLSASNVTTIVQYAFNNCSSLTGITLPASVVMLGSTTAYLSVFAGTAITSLNIPSSVTIIGNGALAGMKKLSSITVDPNNLNYMSCGNVLFDKKQTRIVAVSSTLSGSYIIPQSVTTIGVNAFNYCSSLTSVCLSANVTTIQDSAFNKCVALQTIYVKEATPPTVGTASFTGISPTRKVCATGGNYNAFYNGAAIWRQLGLVKSAIRTLYTTGTIGNGSFANDVINTFQGRTDTIPSLKIKGTLAASDFVRLRQYFPLLNDLNLDSVTIENNKIPDNAFANLQTLTTITIRGIGVGTPIKRIGVNAFQNCPTLTTIVVPSTLDSIYDRAFDNCYSLSSLSFNTSRGIKYIGKSAFRNCKSLTITGLPDSITSIPDSAFYHCFKMTSNLSIPLTVMSIGKNAFDSCYSLKTLTFGKVINKIDDYAFSNCPAIYNITLSALVPPTIDSTPFSIQGGAKNCVLKVPVESSSTYLNDANWSAFSLSPQALGSQCYLTVFFQNGTVQLDGSTVVSGTSKVVYVDSTTCKLTVTPSTGYYIGSVTLNGSPLISSGGVYTTSKLSQNSVVNITLSKIPCFLNIKTQESVLTQTVPYGTKPTVSVSPLMGWVISTVTYGPTGGTTMTDVTSMFANGASFTPTDSITGSVDLAVTYKLSPAGVPQQAIRMLQVYSVNMDIIVSGIASGDKVDVYNASGVMVTSVIAESDVLTIPMSRNGVYLVKTASNGTYKLRI
jgi:BspA type Leucine rich repeat region (6 copies)